MLIIGLCGCAHIPGGGPKRDRGFKVYRIDRGVAEKVALNRLPLVSGQIVLAESGGPLSLLFSLFAEEYSITGHGGVLVVENGRAFVYEAIGIVKPTFYDRPTDGIRGGIRRTELRKFLRRNIYTEIHDPPAIVDRNKMVGFVLSHYQRKTPFDPYFDFTEHDKLYCTEMIALALKAGGYGDVVLTSNRRNLSLEIVRNWLGFSDAGGVLTRSLVKDGVRIAAGTSHSNLGSALIELAVIRELHRRFTVDQKLGNLFVWKSGRLQYRHSIKQFADKADDLLDAKSSLPKESEVFAQVKALAENFFGPVSGESKNVAKRRINLTK